jgi:class 3 adenylate cyclase
MTFDEILDATLEMLKRRKRLTYRAIKRQFNLDDDFLEDVKAEIIQGQRVAVDEGGALLVWTGVSDTKPVPPQEQSTDQIQLATQAERRQLTLMFSDLVGSTILSQRLDPEELLKVVKEYRKTCEEIILQFEGTIQQFMGDGVLVYFGYPVAHENDAQRAVLAALGIIDELPNLNRRLQEICGVELSLRVGIHTGLVVVGELEGGNKVEPTALGETPNLAARIQDLTKPNTVVISEATHNLVKGLFDTQDLGEHDIKGISKAIRLWQVIKKSLAQTRLEVVGTRLTPLVGRDHEVEQLLERWGKVKDGFGQTVMLKGEAGIGKTRLVEELKERVGHEDCGLQEYRCSPFYQNTALYPVIHRLEEWLHPGQENSAAAKLRKLESALKEYRVQTEGIALLGNLLSVPLDNTYTPLELTPETQRQRTLEVLRDLLFERSTHRPVLVVVEDLHWVDPTTLDWLTMVNSQVAKARVLLLLTSRPEFEPAWSDRPTLDTIPLNRLSGIQVRAVATGVAGGKTLPREVTDQVVRRTDGVPLFIEELTKSLLESGLLQQREHEYELARSLPSMTIPTTLQDSLMARLDRLSTAKPVAQLGATLGREFSYKLLHAVSSLQDTILQNELTRLEEAELV